MFYQDSPFCPQQKTREIVIVSKLHLGSELRSARKASGKFRGSWEKVHDIGGFLKWWYPTTIGFSGFPTKNDHFGVFWGYHHLRKHPYESTRKRGQSFLELFTFEEFHYLCQC